MTKIVTVDQFAGVQEGVTVIVPVKNGICRMIWRGGRLHGDLDINRVPQDAQWVLDHYGPLTVQDQS